MIEKCECVVQFRHDRDICSSLGISWGALLENEIVWNQQMQKGFGTQKKYDGGAEGMYRRCWTLAIFGVRKKEKLKLSDG